MKRRTKVLTLLLIVSILISSLLMIIFAATKIIAVKDLSASVYMNQRYSLPTMVDATMRNKKTKQIAVTWSPKTVETSKIGTFFYKGTVKGYAKQVSLTLKVIRTKEDEEILSRAGERRNAILNSKTTVKITGTAYYVSNSGNDKYDGKSPKTAWATIAKVNSMTFNPGDGILFERGGVYRGVLKYRDDITYSAYGEGVKPQIYGSPENGADPKKWALLDGTKNIWVFYKDMYDTGGIVFDDGKSWASRKTAIWDGARYVDVVEQKTPIDVKKLDNMQFFSDIDYTGVSTKDAMLELDRKGKLYLRCDAGNPGAVYSSIEFLSGPNQQKNGGGAFLLQAGSNCIIDNLSLKYFTNSALSVDSNSTVQNCEVSWVGGCIACFNGAGVGTDKTAVLRCGDGILLARGSNSSAINNYVHHIYDNSITVETGPWFSDDQRFAKNMTIKGNLIENSSGGIMVADWDALQSNTNKLIFQNILIEDNYSMYSGYGWSHLVPDYDWGAAGEDNNGNCNIFFGFPAKSGKDIFVKNNVFYLSRYALVGAKYGAKGQTQRYDISFSGNTYLQNWLGILAQYPSLEYYQYSIKYYFDVNAKKTVNDILKDKTGVVLMP